MRARPVFGPRPPVLLRLALASGEVLFVDLEGFCALGADVLGGADARLVSPDLEADRATEAEEKEVV